MIFPTVARSAVEPVPPAHLEVKNLNQTTTKGIARHVHLRSEPPMVDVAVDAAAKITGQRIVQLTVRAVSEGHGRG